ncbi:MAG: phosphate ABC transporter permease PstA, partial [Anaerolineae bacterium]
MSAEREKSRLSGAAGFRGRLGARHRTGRIWLAVFQVSTIIGVIALVALLLNILNGAFGFMAIQNTVEPEDVVMALGEERVLSAPRSLSSEDDEELAWGVAARPTAIGFFGYATYQRHADRLRVLTVDGVAPTAAAVAIVVSRENTFLTEVTTEQLREIFTSAETWADVDPSWPDKPILRFIPGADSGTLDFFVETVFERELADLPKETLVTILQANVSKGLFRRLESEQAMPERTKEEVYGLVLERVIEPEVVHTWSLFDSVFRRRAVVREAAERFPAAEIRFVSWIDPEFITTPQSADPEQAGVRTAILGSLWTIAITVLFAFPLGVGAAIYLEEYATDNWINRLIRTNVNNLAGVPSIIYGMLGLAIFVRAMEPLTSGSLFGMVDPTTANGRTILSAGLTLGLLILPLIIINAREAVRAVPRSLREASFGLGATKWQTIWHHVLPSAMPGVLTGTILAISRAIGETAPLVVVGASTFITVDPGSPFS